MDWEYNATTEGAVDHYGSTGDQPPLDLNAELIHNRSATFFFRMNGDAMAGAGIHNGDILIVDKSLKASNGKIVVAAINGELLVRRFHQHVRGCTLVAENARYGNIEIGEFTQFTTWGLVTCVIHVLEQGLVHQGGFSVKRNRRSI